MTQLRCLLLALACLLSQVGNGLSAPAFFTDAALTTPGLVGSYLNLSLKELTALTDWRIAYPVSGTRVDTQFLFATTNWGARAPLGLTEGTSDSRWGKFSVQWDGYLSVTQPGDRLATVSREGCRMWIDLNGDGSFSPDELFDSPRARPRWALLGEWSTPLPSGRFRFRVQYWHEAAENEFRFATPPFIPRQHTPTTDNPALTVKVIVLNFAPRIPTEGGRKLWEVCNWDDPRRFAKELAADVTASTGGAVTFQVNEWRELDEFPLFTDGTRYTAEQYMKNRQSNSGWKTSPADFYYYAEREKLAALVNAGQVDEIWCLGPHNFNLWSQGGPSEGWMAGPGSFSINGPTFPKVGFDRAIAGHSFNYELGMSYMLHNLCHRVENHGQRAFGTWNLANPATAFDRFSANAANSPGRTAGVGTCHYPANAAADYDYVNVQAVPSTALDWPNYPNLTGATTLVSQDTWVTPLFPDYQRDYLRFYFGMMPRNAGTDAAGRQANWFKYIWDFNSYEPSTGRPREEDAFAAGATIRLPGGTTHDFTVRYYDGTGVDTTSLDAGDILVTGPNGFSQAAMLVSTGSEISTSSGTARTVTYRVTAPGGGWKTSDAGAYSVALRANQVRDTTGTIFPSGVIGQFYVEITNPPAPSDTAPPTVTAVSTNAFRLNQSAHFIQVSYSDTTGVDGTSLDNQDIIVTGPNGYSATASLHSVTTNSIGTPVGTDYWLYPPGGVWKADDNGVYTFALQPGQVKDLNGNFAPGQVLGTFSVVVPPPVRRPSYDLAETNAVDWLSWAQDATATTVDNFTRVLSGGTSVRYSTGGGSDTWAKFPPRFGADWDVTEARNLYFSVFALNTNSFQGDRNSPWIRLYDVSGDYFEYRFYSNGVPWTLLNLAINQWHTFGVPLRGTDTETNGWRRVAYGSPRLDHIGFFEIHADTGGYGFELFYDRVGFDIPVKVTSAGFDPAMPSQIDLSFDQNVAASLGNSSLQLLDLTTSSTIAASAMSIAYDAVSNGVVVTFPGLAGGVLPQGQYRLTIAAGGIADPAGNTLATNFVFQFQNPPPTLLSQPQSQAVVAGDTIMISVSATSPSSPISYQWQFNDAVLPGANSATLTLTNIQLAQAGAYRVMVGNVVGTVLSAAATISVSRNPNAPVIIQQPGTLVAGVGGNVRLTVQAAGAAPLAYQWRKNGMDLLLENQPTFTLGSARTNDAGTYTVVVTNAYGAISSAPAILTVVPPVALTITNQPVSRTVLAGTNVSFSIGVTGTGPVVYQWVKNGVALAEYGATLVLTNVSLADAGNYQAYAYNDLGSIASAVVTLAVQAPPVFLSTPQSVAVGVRSNAFLRGLASGVPTPGYYWLKDGVRVTNAVGYTGLASTQLTALAVSTAHAGNYFLVATNAVGAVTSAPAALTVLLPPQILTQPQSVAVNRTNPAVAWPASFTVLATNADRHAWFHLTATGALPLPGQPWVTGADTATLGIPDVRRTNAGGYFVVLTNLYGTTTSSVANLRVRVPASLGTNGSGPALLPGGRIRLTFGDAEGGAPTAADLANVEVQYAVTLQGTNTVWTRLPFGFTSTNGQWFVEDNAPGFSTRRYYRVIER